MSNRNRGTGDQKKETSAANSKAQEKGGLGHWLWENGLSLVMFGLFLLALTGQAVTGYNTYNDDRQDHNKPQISYGDYLTSGHFIEATFENWESEFLQIGMYVLLTVFLRQKGSSESKALDEPEPVDADPRKAKNKNNTPWPVRQGGLILKLYENSLTLALFGLFLMSFVLHGFGGAQVYNESQLEHGGEAVSTLQFMTTPEFWFQSFQNWQSEFLSVAALVVLSIFLRQRGSPESKPVAAPNSKTGD